jgi:hypothetical protein
MKMEYKHYEGMKVPIPWEILTRSRKLSDLDKFQYIYEGPTEEDYQVANSVEETNNCVTFSDFSTSKENRKDDTTKTC